MSNHPPNQSVEQNQKIISSLNQTLHSVQMSPENQSIKSHFLTKKSKVFTIGALFVLLLTGLGIGFSEYQEYEINNVDNSTTQTTEEKTNFKSSSQETMKDSTGNLKDDWITYSNDLYNYSFSYPPSFSIDLYEQITGQEKTIILSIDNENEDGAVITLDVDSVYSDSQSTISKYGSYTYFKQEREKELKKSGTSKIIEDFGYLEYRKLMVDRVEAVASDTWYDENKSYISQVLFEKDGYVFAFLFASNGFDLNSQKELFSNILDSFRFSEKPIGPITGSIYISSQTDTTMKVDFDFTSSKGELTEMQILTDPSTTNSWQTYERFKEIPISEIIYTKFKDQEGNISGIFSTTRTSPEGQACNADTPCPSEFNCSIEPERKYGMCEPTR